MPLSAAEWRTWTVVLPWPAQALSPNARVHWSAKARAVKNARADAFLAALGAKARHLDVQALSVSVTFCPAVRRNRDDDNLIASLKPSLDGIADAVGINDSRFKLDRVRHGELTERGEVRIELREANE